MDLLTATGLFVFMIVLLLLKLGFELYEHLTTNNVDLAFVHEVRMHRPDTQRLNHYRVEYGFRARNENNHLLAMQQ